jgi:hypothetical protein
MLKIIEQISPSAAERFWTKVEVNGPDECWLWRAGKNRCGYGKFTFGTRATARQYLAHRVAIALVRGVDIEDSQVLRHTCDTPACCNPAHLVTGSHADNMQDKADRGRAVTSFGHAKLSWELVDEIRASPLPGAEWARRLGVSNGNISDIRNHKTWRLSTRATAIVPERKAT